MSIVTKLTALLTADSSQFESGIKKASFSMKGFTTAVKAGAAIAATSLLALGASMLALGRSSATAIERNSDLAASLGVTSKEFKSLSIVAEESGVSQEEFAAAFTKTQKAIYDAANGSKSAQENFAKLGLSVSDLMKMSPADQFVAVSEALSQIQSPTERTALAMELLGKSGRGVINVINMLADLGMKYEEAKEFADKFNISVNDIDSEQVKAAGDAFGRVGMVAEGAGNTIAVEFSPLVKAASDALVNGAISGQQFGESIRSGMSIAGEAIDIVRKAILGFEVLFKGVETSIIMIGAKIQEAFNFIRNQMRDLGINVAPNSTDWIEWAEEAKKQTRSVIDEINNFESTASKLEKIRAESKKLATENANKPNLTTAETDLISVDKSIEKTKELEFETAKLRDVYGELEKSSGDAIDSLISDLGRGGDAMQSFRNFAVSILQDVLKSLNGGNSVGSSLGALIAGGLGSLFGSSIVTQGRAATIGKPINAMYAGLSGITGSYATGTAYVPYDMTARLHKGEMVIPRQQVESSSGNGGMVVNIDARGAGQGVENKIRQVMAEVQQLRQDTPKIALNVVADQSRRNPNFVR
jgi:hypothetical protein